MRRLLIATLLSLFAAPVAAHGQAGATSPTSTAAQSSNCPQFQVLHDDKIGALSLPAGYYAITISTQSTLSCAQAADLFREFLIDFDGRLSGGWTVSASTSSFRRSSPRQSFSVARTGGSAPAGTSTTTPLSGGICPATFDVLHSDHVGSLDIPAGKYILTLTGVGRMSCDQAASNLAKFLQDYNGRLPKPWFVDDETATFLNGTINDGFTLEPLVGDAPGKLTLKLPGDGTPCSGVFSVQHDDVLGKLKVAKGDYLFVPLANSRLSCQRVVDLIREFLAIPDASLPSPWVVDKSTGTLRKGKRSKVGFRLKPAPPERAGRSPAARRRRPSARAWSWSSMRPSERTASTPGASEPRCAASAGGRRRPQRERVRCALAKARQRAARARSTSIVDAEPTTSAASRYKSWRRSPSTLSL